MNDRYCVLVNGLSLDDVDLIVNRAIEFLADNGHQVLEHNPMLELQAGEVSSWGGLKDNEYIEYYSCQSNDRIRVYHFKYFAKAGFSRTDGRFGVLIVLEDQMLAMQLKLMLS